TIPQPVCLTTRTSLVPSSCVEMMMERSESAAMPPALRTTWASPRAMPKAAAGSMRASMQVTGRGERVQVASWAGTLPTTYFLAGGRARLPWSKAAAYCAFFSTRFCWTGVAMFRMFFLETLLMQGGGFDLMLEPWHRPTPQSDCVFRTRPLGAFSHDDRSSRLAAATPSTARISQGKAWRLELEDSFRCGGLRSASRL